MAKVLLARQLTGKKVITTDGEEFGVVVDLDVDELSGKLESLVVDPNPDSSLAEKFQVEEGYASVPYDSVIAVGDYIIVDKRVILKNL